MRILQVNAHGADLSAGGAERYVRDLALGLAARGHEVPVLSAFPEREESGVETHVLHPTDWRDDRVRRARNHLGDLVAAPWTRLAGRLRDVGPDLVHTHNLWGIGTGIWEVARRAGIPVAHTVHGHYLLCPRTTLIRRDGSPCRPHPLLCGARTRRLARWHESVGAVTGPSDYILRVHDDLFPGAPKYLVPPPLKPFNGPAKPPETPPMTLGYVGALTKIKGVRLLLAAAPALAGVGFVVRIAGDGPLRPEVEASDHVRYEGWLSGDSLSSFVGSCDAGMVLTLCNEAGPFVVPEWLAAGRPVIATRRGSLIEMARSGGMVLFDESPERLVKAALGVRDPAQWQRLRDTLPIVNGEEDIDRWLDDHESAYEAAAQLMAGSLT